MTTEQQIALDKLEKAVEAFETELREFRNVYEPNSVGIDEWIESNENTMLELADELNDE